MLDIWANFKQNESEVAIRKIGYPSSSLVFQSGWASKHTEEMEDELDARIYSALDALIFGVGKDAGILTTNEQTAIMNNHVSAVFQSNRIDINMHYDFAKAKLKRGMEKRGFITS